MRRTRITAFGVAASLAVASIAVSGPAGAASAPRVRVLPATVASDCSVDVTNSVSGFIQEQRNGTTIRFRKGACYRVDGTIAIIDRKNITVDGNGATVKAVTPGARGRRHVAVQGGRNITVRDLTVIGPHEGAGAVKSAYQPQYEFQHGFAFLGVQHARLERVRVEHVYGDFVYIGPSGEDDSPTYRWSRDVRVTGSTFTGGGRQGISITGGKQIRIDHNTIGDVPRSLFDFESNTGQGGAVDVTVDHNSTGAAVNFWLANKGAGLNTRKITFDRNTMTAPTGGLVFVFGPTSGYRGPFTFTRNRLEFTDRVHDEGSQGAFTFAGATDVTVRDNTGTFPASPKVPIVESRGSRNVVVTGNRIANAGPDQITIDRPGQVAGP